MMIFDNLLKVALPPVYNGAARPRRLIRALFSLYTAAAAAAARPVVVAFVGVVIIIVVVIKVA